MTAYFVSLDGSDGASGTGPAKAWKSVGRVNQADLAPGDTVLFRGGDAFTDAPLMPPAGGALSMPITFSTFGSLSRPAFTGAWFIDKDYLLFDGLKFGSGGFQGGNDSGHFAHHITVQRCTIDVERFGGCGLLSNGDDWQIVNNLVRNTGDSGLRLEGDDYQIVGNRIFDTGTDASIPYGKHGIYLLASNARVHGNRIRGFSADGVSARFRSSAIEGNHISGGAIGIGFFQYDAVQGFSRWLANDFQDLSDVGVWVSPSDRAGPTVESFQIGPNSYTLPDGVPEMNLSPTTGSYVLT